MSNQAKTMGGEAAFGHAAENGHCCGLTKREYFAGLADPREIYGSGEDSDSVLPSGVAEALMGGLPPSYATQTLDNAKWWSEAIARWKVLAADALLSALAKESDQ